MTDNWAPLVWLAGLFVPLLLIERWLSRHLQGVGLLFFGRHDWATALYYFVLFPGVAVHELSHWLAAKLVGVPTKAISVLPDMKRSGSIRLGAVRVGKSDPLRESLIGLAPLIGGSAVILLLASWQFRLELGPILSFETIWNTLWASLRAPDSMVRLYLVFSISNAMLPSESDRQPWLSALVFLALVTAIIYVVGATVRIRFVIAEWVLTGATYLALAFGLALAVDIPVALLLFVIEKLGALLLGRHVQY